MSDVECPRAKSWMTPCVARDGATAIDDPAAARPVCVGCGSDPRELLADLAERFPPAREHVQTEDPAACADALTRMVAEYVESKP